MGDYISEIVIIKEYLNNWFTYKDLADYLCIKESDVKKAIKSLKDEDIIKKVNRHHYLVEKYYKQMDNDEKLEIDPEYRQDIDMAFYIINNHCSIRECAKEFNKGKTTVHEHIHNRLPEADILLYKNVFDVLMDNKSFDINNKNIIEQVLQSYELLLEGHTIDEISQVQKVGWNVVERNLTRRLERIDKDKFDIAKKILEKNQKDHLKEHEFKCK